MQHGVAILYAKRSGDPAQKEVDMAKSKKKKKRPKHNSEKNISPNSKDLNSTTTTRPNKIRRFFLGTNHGTSITSLWFLPVKPNSNGFGVAENSKTTGVVATNRDSP